MSTQAVSKNAPPVGGIKTKNLVVIALFLGSLWAIAFSSGSGVFLGIVGGITGLALLLLGWGWRQIRKQKQLASLLQGAAHSPEARREALATLAADPKANDPTHILLRAQLLSAEDPAAALTLLEPLELSKVSPSMQDDVAILKSQLYLTFGRVNEARPLADKINVDSPVRKEHRATMVAIVAEAWARTGSAPEAQELLNSVDPRQEADDQVRAQLMMAQVFVRFGAGNKGATRAALKQLAAMDVNLLGRFVTPKFKVHAGLQRLAREEAQRHQQVRQPAGRRRRV